jgi:hypothetical protein
MKSLAEFYPGFSEANFYVFLGENELEELTKKPVAGDIYMADKSFKKFVLELRNGNYLKKCDKEIGVILNDYYLMYFYESKLSRLKETGIIGGRIGELYKYDICLESKAKDYGLAKALDFIDSCRNYFPKKIAL